MDWVGLMSTDPENGYFNIIDQIGIESFNMRMLDDPDATLFVIAPNSGTVAGAAVALIDSIIQYFRKKTANHQLTHRLLLELDEVCNSCPLPALLNYVGESAGLGVNLMATVQASSHFDVSTDPNTLTHCVISSPERSSSTGHTNATCSNKHPTGSAWPHAAASHTSPTRAAARRPPNSAPPLTGKISCLRTEKKPNCCAAAPPVNGSTSETGATSCRSGIALSSNAFASGLCEHECGETSAATNSRRWRGTERWRARVRLRAL